MGEDLPIETFSELNKKISDRSDVFYWQTDRAVEPDVAGKIWADRHRYFDDSELINRVNETLSSSKIVEIMPFEIDSQTNLGNVNSVREARLSDGSEVVVRCHPKGIKNGYFHAETEAAKKVKLAGLPSYKTLAIHDHEGGDDFSFQVIEKLPGMTIKNWLSDHPEDEDKLLQKIGAMMARVHSVEVEGFGPFNNEKAKSGELVGLHSTQEESFNAGLDFNLSTLHTFQVFSETQCSKIKQLFENNKFLNTNSPVLVHNDFADWNLLTDGADVTGILDFDECVAGDPIMDIACWSTFFHPDRMPKFLEGYFSIAVKEDDFEEKFELMRFRYTISKMTLRLRRFSWEPSDEIKERIEAGKTHLAASLNYFGVNDG